MPGLGNLARDDLNTLTLATRASIYTALLTRLNELMPPTSAGSCSFSGGGGDGGHPDAASDDPISGRTSLPPHGPRREDARAFAVAVFTEVSRLVPSAPVSVTCWPDLLALARTTSLPRGQ